MDAPPPAPPSSKDTTQWKSSTIVQRIGQEINRRNFQEANTLFRRANFYDDLWADKSQMYSMESSTLFNSNTRTSRTVSMINNPRITINAQNLKSLLRMITFLCGKERTRMWSNASELMEQMFRLFPLLLHQMDKDHAQQRQVAEELIEHMQLALAAIADALATKRDSVKFFNLMIQEHVTLLYDLDTVWRHWALGRGPVGQQSMAAEQSHARGRSDTETVQTTINAPTQQSLFIKYLPMCTVQMVKHDSLFLLEVTSLADVCLLQRQTTQFLQVLFERHPQEAEASIDAIFPILHVQLQLGTTDLKKASLKTINNILKHLHKLAVRYPIHNFAETIVAVLNAGQESQQWPAFRTEEFDSALAMSLHHMRKSGIYFSQHFGLRMGIIDSFIWNVSHTTSATIKRELFNCFVSILKIPEDTSTVPLIRILMPFLGDKVVQNEMVHILETVFDMLFQSITSTQSSKKRSRENAQTTESGQSITSYTEDDTTSLARSNKRKKRKLNNDAAVNIAADNDVVGDTESVLLEFLGKDMTLCVLRESEEVQASVLSLFEHIKSAISSANEKANDNGNSSGTHGEEEEEDRDVTGKERSSTCETSIRYCVILLHLFLRLCYRFRTTPLVTSFAKAAMELLLKIEQCPLQPEQRASKTTSKNGKKWNFSDEFISDMLDMLECVVQLEALSDPVPQPIFQLLASLLHQSNQKNDPTELEKKSLRILSMLPHSAFFNARKTILAERIVSLNLERIKSSLEYFPLFISKTNPSEYARVFEIFIPKLRVHSNPELPLEAAATTTANALQFPLAKCVHETLQHVSRLQEHQHKFKYFMWEPFLDLLKEDCDPMAQTEMLHAFCIMLEFLDEDTLRTQSECICNRISTIISGTNDSLRRLSAHNLFSVLSRDDAKRLKLLFNIQDDADKLFRRVVTMWIPESPVLTGGNSTTTTDSSETENRKLESLVIAIGSIGCGARGRLLLLCIYRLFESLVSDIWIISGCSFDALRQIAKAKEKKVVGEIIDEQFHDNFYNDWLIKRLEVDGNAQLIAAVGQVAFDCGSLALFMHQVLPTILPQLVMDGKRTVIDKLSNVMNPDNHKETSKLILGNGTLLTEIFLRSASIEDAMKPINFLIEWIISAKAQEDHFDSLFNGVVDVCLRELIWRLGSADATESESALRVLCNIHKIKTSQFNFDSISGVMRLKFVGVMEFVIERMRLAEVVDERKHALRSLNGIMNLPGVISKCRTKLMQCLMMALKDYPQLVDEICSSCKLYIERLADGDDDDRQHCFEDLIQIVAVLLDLVNVAPDAVASFIEWAVCEQFQQETERLAQHLPAMPDIPQLSKVHSMLNINTDLFFKLKRLLKFISTGNYAIRKVALKELRDAIRNNHSVIQNSITTTDNFHPLLSDLVSSLLRGMSSADNVLLVLFAECLGALGAIEPSRLKIPPQFDTREELDDLELALTILRDYLFPHVVIAHYRKNDSMQTAGYAVQGLLRFCVDCESRTGNVTQTMEDKELLQAVSTKRWWNDFDDNVRETFEGYLTSKYVAKEKVDSKKFEPNPVYKKGQDVRRWLTEWTRHMIKKSTGSRAGLFQFCRGIMRHDISIMLFLLPYIVLHVITCGTDEDRVGVVKAISAVLHATKNDAKAQHETSTMASISTASASAATTTTMMTATAAAVEMSTADILDTVDELALLPLMDSHKKHHSTFEHCQQLFSLLDVLHKWRSKRMQQVELAAKERERKSRDSKSRRSSGSSSSSSVTVLVKQQLEFIRNMDSVLNKISNIMLSFAAFASGAYERALKYYEIHLASEAITVDSKGKILRCFKPHQLSFLQKLYSKLGEPDGLAGIASFRMTTSLHEQIIDHEAQGNWSEALNCYELAIDQLSTKIEQRGDSMVPQRQQQIEAQILSFQLNILKCLRNLGNLRVMDENVQGMLSRLSFKDPDPSTTSKIVGYGVQAAWRLGNWDRLRECLEELNRQDTFDFEVSLARTLMSYRSSDREAFQEQLQISREHLVGPLSACRESYELSYPLIVNLQILEELERSFELTIDTSSLTARKAKPLLEQLRNSLALTTSSMEVREPIIALRKQIFSMHSSMESVSNELGRTILSWAKLARKSQQLQTASSAILQLQNDEGLQKPANFFLESAKLQWQKGNKQQAIVIMDSGREAIYSGTASDTLFTQHSVKNTHYVKYIMAKMQLLSVQWSEQLKQKRPEDVQDGYRKIIDELPEWEDGYFHLGRYLDSLYTDERQQLELHGNRLPKLTDVLKSLENSEAESTPKSSRSSSSRTRSAKTLTNQSQNIVVDKESIQAMLELEQKRLTSILQNYGTSLKYGTKHIFQSLPRMLTLWFNTYLELKYVEECVPSTYRCSNDATSLQEELDRTIDELNLPPYEWYSVLTQLISRLGYSNKVLVNIVADVFEAYPQQTIWRLSTALFTMAKNQRGTARKEDASNIVKQGNRNNITKAISDEHSIVIKGLMKLSDASLTESARKSRESRSKFQFSKINDTKGFRRHLQSNHDKHFILPLQRSLNIATLPQQSKAEPLQELDHGYNPFLDPTRIDSFEEEITVMNSLAKPKRVAIVGSDGNRYGFLCKPKDDLRKDSRLMEYQQMINKLLKADPESRRRNLHIRTYAVVPLNEQTGMVEWVNDTEVMRNLILGVDLPIIQKRHEKILKKKQANMGPVPSVYFTELAHHKLMFHDWFLKQFPEPAQWFRSRLNYTRSLATLSMSSFIVGLGDRHTENFLMDFVTGEVVQIDLAMLFEQGRFLTVPEQVPFRLTRNLVDGMGVTGYEGVFRRVCEMSMRVLRDNKETLLNVLESFVHDPLLDWNKSERHVSNNVKSEYQSYGSEVHINVISKKLSGCVADSKSIGTVGLKRAYDESVPLGVQGQVNTLINQATSDENLSKMFIWWMAFL